MTTPELSDQDLKMLTQSLNHCIDTCSEAPTKRCNDCDAARALLDKLSKHQPTTPELIDRELKMLMQSLNHCIDTCSETPTKRCNDCDAARALLDKLSKRQPMKEVIP